jgi:hypothetical protein
VDMKPQEIESKEAELTAKHGRKVTCHAFAISESDTAYLFLKNPDPAIKMMAIDVSMESFTKASDYLFKASALKEESDLRFFSGKEEDEDLYFGALMTCQQLVKFAIGEVKKK